MQNGVYSVSQLNHETKRLLALHFMTVQVAGEISNLGTPSSGHLYFSLKDKQAQVRCALFKPQQHGLNFRPTNGNQVIVTAQVTLYEARGEYQLIVERMEAAGDGALRQAFEHLKQKLQSEGLFELGRKKPLPLLPKQIGLITSASGAAVRDVLTVLKRRFPAIPVLIYPVAVQGEAAKNEIARALADANRHQYVDLLILTRGGGSLEDLQAFNDEIVARSIAASRIPVIAAIGHEVDVTIADFVADFRAATPSAAAEHAVPHQEEWSNIFVGLERRIQRHMQNQLAKMQQLLAWRNKRLQQLHPGQRLRDKAQRLDEFEQRLKFALQNKLHNRVQQLAINQHKLKLCLPAEKIARRRLTLTFLRQRLNRAMNLKLAELHHRHAASNLTLNAVSPLATLERGYAIVQRRDNGHIIKSTSQIAIGDLLSIRLAKDSLLGEVKDFIDVPNNPSAQKK